ncbi:hypothetical protein J1605_010023 [Eschrichtius robustus]|uniref:U6 snRNA-associated Sm-like protein LSm7 n=1 Tax=Eschrichtius robustus TaxID=9764 RepID=A0AB34GSR4_ESCRO|nr:hypothetical protein J1605_010023 [Eschrichtius robustus]
MSPGPSLRRRQMFPSNAPAHRTAQAPCVRRACARGKVQRARRRLLRTTKRPGKMADKEKKKKESILDLSKYIDKTIRVKFQGGREGRNGYAPFAGGETEARKGAPTSLEATVAGIHGSASCGSCLTQATVRPAQHSFSSDALKVDRLLDLNEIHEAVSSGILKGFDPLLNLVLDGTIEYMRGECSAWGSEASSPGLPYCSFQSCSAATQLLTVNVVPCGSDS